MTVFYPPVFGRPIDSTGNLVQIRLIHRPEMQEFKALEIAAVRYWYEPHLEWLHEDASTRLADLVQLEQIAGGYPSRTHNLAMSALQEVAQRFLRPACRRERRFCRPFN